jgi:hypothetical protein
VPLNTLVSEAQASWRSALPRCNDPACHRIRGLWRRISLRRSGVRMHGAWYCAPQCFENALQRRFAQANLAVVPVRPLRHRIPLGLMMLSRGQVDNHQLRSALDAQRQQGGRIGEWLEQLGFATEQQVTAALGLQWACPVLPMLGVSDLHCAEFLPFRLLERFCMLPVRFVVQTRVLYMAFSEGVDYGALYAIEQMLECRTEPCLIARSAMESALDRLGQDHHSSDLLFEGHRQAGEMARIASGYVLKWGARNVRLVTCGDYIWVRLEARNDVVNLLFQNSLPTSDEHTRVSTESPLSRRALG